MNKLFYLPLLCLVLSSCGSGVCASYTMELRVTADYGLHINNKVTILYQGMVPFVDLKTFHINDEPLPGDLLFLAYTGEFIVRETYPAMVDLSNCRFIGAKLNKAIYHEINEDKLIKDKYGHIVDFAEGIAHPDYVILKDNDFIKLSDYEGETLYGTLGYTDYDDGKIYGPSALTYTALYSYNPREN